MRSADAVGLLIWWLIASTASAQPSVFFEENFDGPLSSVWRTEILTSGARWCDTYPGAWRGPGVWVEEGVECYGVAAHSPYGSAPCSDGMVHFSSSNGRACPYLVSRRPGPVDVFPPAGDFTLKIRMRYDRITPWGDGLMVVHRQGTEPTGDNAPAPYQDLVVGVWADHSDVGSLGVVTGLNGYFQVLALVPSPNEIHEYMLQCIGNTFTISVDGSPVYGPVAQTIRPTAIWMGNPGLAYWYPTDWTSFSVDAIRVEVPEHGEGACCFPAGVCLLGTQLACQMAGGHYVGDWTTCEPDPCSTVAVEPDTWGRIKANYR